MNIKDTIWYKGFQDGLFFKDKQVFEDAIDQEEYDSGFFEGRTAYFETAYN